MITRYRASLGGIQLDSLHKDLYILDIQHSPIERQDSTFEVANLEGFDTGNVEFKAQKITITFELHIYDTVERNKVCQQVNEWANLQHNMTISDRPGQYLRAVKCTQYASIASVRNWTDPLTLVFTTERNPFWLSEKTVVATVVGSNVRGTLKLDGNVSNSLIECEITAQDTITSIQITAGSTVLKLSKLALATGKKLVISYDKGRYLRIMENGKSAMEKLDPTSSDNLLAACGSNVQVGVIANNRVTAKFTGRGCWL